MLRHNFTSAEAMPTPLIKHRVKLWFVLIFTVIIVSTITRIILFSISWDHLQMTIADVSGIIVIGWFFDLINALYFAIPLVLYLWLCPDRIFNKPWHKYVTIFWFFIFSALLIFNSVAEILFWDEFQVRFNFIAVDYLIYTNEVIGNIYQSYPVFWMAVGIVFATIITMAVLSRFIKPRNESFSVLNRSKYAGFYLLILVASYCTVSTRLHHFSSNAYVNELAGNGTYELFAAYINNELDYDRFYRTMPEKKAVELVHSMMTTSDVSWKNKHVGVERLVVNPGPEKRLNVVLISVESFSAEFMNLFGNKQNLTPFLDSLANHSLIFTNLYATGTRTVRGLEALSLCVPPTPGQSIVRRPHNEHLFSLGKVYRDKGYSCEYIYGGYGYFDNMNYFFGNNEYRVVDRTALNNQDIHYENVWGVADEDLFTLAEKEIDAAVRTRPTFVHIMTTTNHRPFTYPEGRIDIPSHTGRAGAVKYTDFAIGNFIKRASKKPWFQNTIFVIVADHCASSAGKTELPVNKYHIPMLVYSPGIISPATMDRLMSQIDIGPTLLGLMNFSYESKFFGYDIFKVEPGRERAFISTYQSLGYLRNNRLTILSPQMRVDTYQLSKDMQPEGKIQDPLLENEAIAWYQTASHAFKDGLMKSN